MVGAEQIVHLQGFVMMNVCDDKPCQDSSRAPRGRRRCKGFPPVDVWSVTLLDGRPCHKRSTTTERRSSLREFLLTSIWYKIPNNGRIDPSNKLVWPLMLSGQAEVIFL